MCSAPHWSARLTSLPEPAPMISTFLNAGRPASRLSKYGSAYAGKGSLRDTIC